MVLTDLHTHSFFSFDGHSSVEEHCIGAVQKGLKVLALTEHFDILNNRGDTYFDEHNSERKEEMQRCCEKYGDRLLLLKGVEIGQGHINIEIEKKLLKKNDFDIVLGSVHNLADGRDVYMTDYKTEEQCEAIMQLYLDEVYNLACVCDYDVLAHIDFPMRKMENVYKEPKNYTMKQYEEKVREILKTVVKRDKSLEINTRGLICWESCICPENWILKAYREYKGEYVSVGSDSHFSRFVGLGMAESTEALKINGFSRVTYYKGRKPYFLEI